MREGSGTQSIHIVDDDEAVRDSLAALVESAGLSAKAYASAIELLTSPGGLAADCLVADIRMPEMDGLELQQELKRRGMTMPLILITGHADVGLAVQAMKAGASDFLDNRASKYGRSSLPGRMGSHRSVPSCAVRASRSGVASRMA